MRYGGHQTFTIRDGWLHKAMKFLCNDEERHLLTDEYAADHLGVGRNMAKSINHWLLATGLAQKGTEKSKDGRDKASKELEPTFFGKKIWIHDSFFIDPGTWWLLHINLVNDPSNAATWNWFFNKFAMDRFQKAICLQSLIRNENTNAGRSPSQTTLDRDLSCFLSSYSKEIPSKKKDPEDEIVSPFVELGLMRYYRSSGYYQVIRDRKNVDFNIFMYAVKKAIGDDYSIQKSTIEIPFFELANISNGPCRVFSLTNEGLFELLLSYESLNGRAGVQLIGLAGERLVRLPNDIPIKWLQKYYSERK
jgi:hypothetical protein